MFTPLGSQPLLGAFAAWVVIEFAEQDEVSNAVGLTLCELLFFCPVIGEKDVGL